MNKAINISSIFPKNLFWDVKPEQLDVVQDKELIIPRAFYFTTTKTFEHDIERLEQLYSRVEIVSQLKSTREKISNNVCQLVADRYHIPAFRRFAR